MNILIISFQLASKYIFIFHIREKWMHSVEESKSFLNFAATWQFR